MSELGDNSNFSGVFIACHYQPFRFIIFSVSRCLEELGNLVLMQLSIRILREEKTVEERRGDAMKIAIAVLTIMEEADVLTIVATIPIEMETIGAAIIAAMMVIEVVIHAAKVVFVLSIDSERMTAADLDDNWRKQSSEDRPASNSRDDNLPVRRFSDRRDSRDYDDHRDSYRGGRRSA